MTEKYFQTFVYPLLAVSSSSFSPTPPYLLLFLLSGHLIPVKLGPCKQSKVEAKNYLNVALAIISSYARPTAHCSLPHQSTPISLFWATKLHPKSAVDLRYVVVGDPPGLNSLTCHSAAYVSEVYRFFCRLHLSNFISFWVLFSFSRL